MGNYLTLVEKHIIRESSLQYKELDHLCFLSKNLYNSTLYSIRQHYFSTKKYLDYYKVNKEFTIENQIDYRALPAKVSKHTQMKVDRNFKSFFSLLKQKNQGSYTKPVNLPKYLDKTKGRQVVFYEKGALSLKTEGYIKLSKTNIIIKTKLVKDSIQFVRVVPKGNHIVIEVGYRKETDEYIANSRYASIDLGLNNLMTVGSNCMPPFIINGRPLKSMNQYYNKELSIKKAELIKNEGKYTSKKIQSLHLKRNNKVNDYIHKATTVLVNQLVSNQISNLVIGYNKGWKQDINIGTRNNQNFIQIPFYKVISQLEYKCNLVGIKVSLQEESYTSKCSFLDNEEVKKHGKYKGTRTKRGLYVSSLGKEINADINGAMNILKKYLERKEVWNLALVKDCIEVCSTPNVGKLRIPM